MNPERRCAGEARVEMRAAGSPPAIVGRAATYGAWTTLYESRRTVYRERIQAGAFKNAIAERQDVRALFNHDANFVLGRTAAGTLRLEDREDGLAYEVEPPDTQTVRDLVLVPMARGDITGSSFAFSVRPGGQEYREYEGDDGRDVIERTITDADLYDVSPVTYPAYEQSTSALRSLAPEVRSRIEAREARPAPTPRLDALRHWAGGFAAELAAT